jgi:hypothetical protein
MEHTIDERGQKFLYQAGLTIATWGKIENELGNIFLDIVDCRTPGPASIAYSSITTFKSKVLLVAEILDFRPEFKQQTTILDDWKRIKKNFDALNRQRNDIVHGIFVQMHGKESTDEIVPMIVPSLNDSRTWQRGNVPSIPFSKSIRLEDLVQAEIHFNSMWERLAKIHALIRRVLALPEIFVPQPIADRIAQRGKPPPLPRPTE